MIKFNEIYDITLMSGRDTLTDEGPDRPAYSSEQIWKLDEGKIANLYKLVMNTHHGTHVDVPYHMIPDGRKLDDYPIERWVCPAKVVAIEDKESIKPRELKGLDIRPGDAVLFKTSNTSSGLITRRGAVAESWVYISPEASDLLVEKKVNLVGIDYFSVEKPGDMSSTTHKKLLGNEILIIEGIYLRDVSPGEYTIFCFPLNLKGTGGGPARVVLLR